MEKETGLDIFHCGPTAPDGGAYFLPGSPLPTLERIRRKIGNRNYSLQILNQTPAEGFFELSTADLNMYSKGTDALGRRFFLLHAPDGTTRKVFLHDLWIFHVLDPNVSKNSQSSRSANIVAGLAKPLHEMDHFQIIILSALAKATTPKGALEMARAEYLFWKPIIFALETVAAQQSMKEWLLSAYPDMMVKGVRPDGGASKLSRIRAFTPFGENGHLYVHPSVTDFIDEWESFPTGFMDLLDACAYLPYIWTIPTVSSTPPNPRDEISSLGGRRG